MIFLWIAHLYGLLGSGIFLGFYLTQAPPWRRVEDPLVRIARNDVLIWTTAVFIVYVTTSFSLLEGRFALSLWGSISWRIFVDLLITHRLYAQYRIRHDRKG